ncbi:MAG: AAA family ATPase [Desulfatiglandales bacterium]
MFKIAAKRRLCRYLEHETGKGASLPQPRGVLLTGPPGCGKSYLVQALAGSWGVNLVRLEPARLFRSFVGETEQNFISAFETVQALAPAILWIDELEKLFAHGAAHGGDGGVLPRVLSLFLDFLQSSREGTFVCATTNAIAGLPQEILRPGRFDAVFFIDLPNRKERQHIFTILFRKYGLAGKLEGSEQLLNATESFSGAEMEQAVIDMLYEAGEGGLSQSEFALLRNIRKIVPLARTMKENFDLMRQWHRSRARAASIEDKEEKGGRKICPISPR